jgi:hypothetical protein
MAGWASGVSEEDEDVTICDILMISAPSYFEFSAPICATSPGVEFY